LEVSNILFIFAHKSEIAMARKLREKSCTGIYHVIMRGINRQDIFEDEGDYRFFKKILFDLTHPIDNVTQIPLVPRCIFYAYCFMSNHVHLLIKETEEPLASVAKRISVTYARYYNTKYVRFGHLFQDRYKSEPVNDQSYFFTLLQYIHQNPVAAGISKTVNDYPWSSWEEYKRYGAGLDEICKVEHVLQQMNYSDLEDLVNTMLPKSQSILDYDSGLIIRSDDEVRDFLKRKFKIRTPHDIQLYTKERRREMLAEAKAFGASYRQLSRLTGISIYLISKA